MADPPEFKNFQPCKDTSDCVELCITSGLFLKPIARLNITVTLPHLKSGQVISNFEVMEKLQEAIKPDEFVSIVVSKSNLEFLRFDAEVETRAKLNAIVNKIDQKGIKLGNLSELLKIRATEAKLSFPSRHDWDTFFRDAKHMNEMKAGERPDTVHLQDLPSKWFAVANSEKPSEHVIKKAFASFGDIRTIDIPTNDPYRKQMTAAISGISTFNFKQDFLFEAYVQFKEYIGFAKCMHALQGKKLVHNYGNKAWNANIKVDFDKTKHLSEYSIRKRTTERERLMSADRERDEKLRRQKEMEEFKKEAEKMQEEEEVRKKQAVLDEQRKEKEQRRRQREMKRRLRRVITKEGAENGEINDERLANKIALEERKLLITQRKLESIRLFDVLFQRIKVEHRQELINLQEDGLKKQKEEPTKAEWFDEKCKQAYDLKVHFKKLYLAKRTPAREKQFRSSSKFYKKVCHKAREEYFARKKPTQKREDSPSTKESKLRQNLITSLKLRQQQALVHQQKIVERVARGKKSSTRRRSLSYNSSTSNSDFTKTSDSEFSSSESDTSFISSEFVDDHEALERAFQPPPSKNMNFYGEQHPEDPSMQAEDNAQNLFHRGRGRHLYQRAYHRGFPAYGRGVFPPRGRGRGYYKDGRWIDLEPPKGGDPGFEMGHMPFQDSFHDPSHMMRGNPLFHGRGGFRGRFFQHDNRRASFRRGFNRPFQRSYADNKYSHSRSRSRSSSHSRSRKRSASSHSRSSRSRSRSRPKSKARSHSKSRSRSRSQSHKRRSRSTSKNRNRSMSASSNGSSRSLTLRIRKSASPDSKSRSRSGRRSKFKSRFSLSRSSSRSSSYDEKRNSPSKKSRSRSHSRSRRPKSRHTRSRSNDKKESRMHYKGRASREHDVQSEPDLSSESNYGGHDYDDYPYNDGNFDRHFHRGRGDFHGRRNFRFFRGRGRGRGRGEGYQHYHRGGFRQDRFKDDNYHEGKKWHRNSQDNWDHHDRGRHHDNYRKQQNNYSPRGDFDVEEYHHMYKRYFKSLNERDKLDRRFSDEEYEVERNSRHDDRDGNHYDNHKRGYYKNFQQHRGRSKEMGRGRNFYNRPVRYDRPYDSRNRHQEDSPRKRSDSSSGSEYEKDDLLLAKERKYRENIITRLSKRERASSSEDEERHKEVTVSSKVVVSRKRDFPHGHENRSPDLDGKLYSDRYRERDLKERITSKNHSQIRNKDHFSRDKNEHRNEQNNFRGRHNYERRGSRGHYRSPFKRAMNRRDHNRDAHISDDSDTDRSPAKNERMYEESNKPKKYRMRQMEAKSKDDEAKHKTEPQKENKTQKNKRQIRQRVVESDDDDDHLQYGPPKPDKNFKKRNLTQHREKSKKGHSSSLDSDSDDSRVKKRRRQ